MHAARLGYQGLELLETGMLTLPMREPERSRVMAIRTGERTFDEAMAEIEEVERRLAEALERTELSRGARRRRRNAFLVSDVPPRLGMARPVRLSLDRPVSATRQRAPGRCRS